MGGTEGYTQEDLNIYVALTESLTGYQLMVLSDEHGEEEIRGELVSDLVRLFMEGKLNKTGMAKLGEAAAVFLDPEDSLG